MPIDIKTETLVNLRDAAKLLPRRRSDKRPHVSCMYRWTTRGFRGVILESVSVGGTRCTSVQALERFFAAISPAHQVPKAACPPTQSRNIGRQLDDAGIK